MSYLRKNILSLDESAMVSEKVYEMGFDVEQVSPRLSDECS